MKAYNVYALTIINLGLLDQQTVNRVVGFTIDPVTGLITGGVTQPPLGRITMPYSYTEENLIVAMAAIGIGVFPTSTTWENNVDPDEGWISAIQPAQNGGTQLPLYHLMAV